MFNQNPFVMIDSYLQNSCQKFVLYMLDRYNLLVSYWIYITAIITIFCCFFENLEGYLYYNKGLVFTTTSFIIQLVVLPYALILRHKDYYILEKQKKFDKYNLKVINTKLSDKIVTFVLIYIVCFLVMTGERAKNLATIIELIIFVPNFILYEYFKACYARDREPLFKINVVLQT